MKESILNLCLRLSKMIRFGEYEEKSYTTLVDHKFMCPKHSEAKRKETSEFGAGKGLLQDQARRTGDSCSKTPDSSMGLGE